MGGLRIHFPTEDNAFLRFSVLTGRAAAAFLLILSLAACSTTARQDSDSVILAPVEAFVHALTYADVDALERAFAPDATVFMPFDELPARIEGSRAIRDAFAPYFKDLRASDRKPPYFTLEPRDRAIQRIGDGVALVTFHLGTLPPAGSTEPVRFSRRSVVVKRYASGWRIAHLHASNVTVARR